MRTGYVIARNPRAKAQWDSRRGRGVGGLTGKALDQQVSFIAMRMPGKVKTERVN